MSVSFEIHRLYSLRYSCDTLLLPVQWTFCGKEIVGKIFSYLFCIPWTIIILPGVVEVQTKNFPPFSYHHVFPLKVRHYLRNLQGNTGLTELALVVFMKKLWRATHAFLTFAIIGLRNILNLDAIIPNGFSIILLALDNV